MYIVKYGHYTLPIEQLDMTETQGFSRNINTIPLPGAGGSWDSDGYGQSPLTEDTINKTFFIDASDEILLEDEIDIFVNAMSHSPYDRRQGTRLLIAQMPNNSLRATWAKCQEARWNREWFTVGNSYIGPVNVTWRRTWPTWWTYHEMLVLGDHHTFESVEAAGFTWGQSVQEQVITENPASFSVVNSGLAPITIGIIEVEGAIDSPTLINNMNKHRFTYNNNLTAIDRLTVNLANFEVKKNGFVGGAGWESLTVGTERGQLVPMIFEPGINNMTLLAASGIPACTIRFYIAGAWR